MTRNATNKFNNMKTGVIGQLPVRSEIMDSKGRLLAYYYPRGIDREPVSYNQISPIMRKAIVAIEDSRFYQHGAIDVRGTFRAIVNDIEHKQVQGGSTLTQQYVKNALILTAPNTQMAQQATSETLTRKIKELRLAIDVEKKMTKDQVLAGYLNAAFFGTFYGNQAVGVGAAAERYFDTTAAKLTLPQAAMLAGMVENPALDNPVTDPQRPSSGATLCWPGWPSCTSSPRPTRWPSASRDSACTCPRCRPAAPAARPRVPRSSVTTSSR